MFLLGIFLMCFGVWQIWAREGYSGFRNVTRHQWDWFTSRVFPLNVMDKWMEWTPRTAVLSGICYILLGALALIAKFLG